MNNLILTPDIPIKALSWRNNPKIYQWCRQTTVRSLQEHSDWINSLKDDKTKKMFGITIDGTKGTDVGVCGFTSIDYLHRKSEFSLYISPEEQGKGYGKEALLLLLKHGFTEFNFNRIWGETFHGNPALDMFIRLGMTHEGIQRQSYFKSGKMIDSHIVSILQSEWFERYGNT